MDQVKRGANSMDMLLFLGIVVVWIVLQAWILPKFGVST